jgi:hypothetical protein
VRGDFFQSSFGKGMGSYKRGGDLSKGLFFGWSGRGLVVSKARGVVFFPLFSKNFFLDEVR